MDSQLERLLLDLKADRVSKEHVKRFLKERQEPAEPGSPTGAPPAVPPSELLRCHPVWKTADTPATARKPGHVVLLAGPSALEDALRRQDATVDVRLLRSGATGFADRYAELAAQALTSLRPLAGDPELRPTLVQLVVSPQGDDILLSGLIGMVRSAGLENPGIVPQLLLVDPAAGPTDTAARILDSRERGQDRVVRFRDGVREVLTWHESVSPEQTATSWREGGTYVVTGGLGGLGLIFARDLLRSVQNTTVLLSGRSALDSSRRHLLEGLYRPQARVEYNRLDVSDPAAVEAYLAGVRREHGAIHGVIHSAGVLRDGFVAHKSAEEVREVLAPKTAGTLNLDAATKDDALDFFALFSSTAAVTGNVGQCDYAAANAFLDAFAHHRGGLVAQGLRSGRSLSLNWPLWAEGGMPVDTETEQALREQTGMHALRTESGIRVFHESLGSEHCQVMAVEGDVPRIRRTLLGQSATSTGSAPAPATVTAPVAAPPEGIGEEALLDRVVSRLRQLLSDVIGLPVGKIDAQTPLTDYGIDSIVVTRLNRKLAAVFPDLPRTLLYDFNALDALASYFLRAHRQGCLDWTGTAAPRQAAAAPRQETAHPAERQAPAQPAERPAPAAGPSASAPTEDAIAVIGMSGRFPQARNLREFWENLAAGRDCVTEIPEGRWPLEGFYHPDRDEAVAAGLSYSKWGGFLDEFAEFDPLFFSISPQEAMSMDPQERLFLQESWNALEDAGYTRQRLADAHRRNVGVFAGVSKTGFDLYGPDLWRRDEKLHPLTSFASVANRVSYLLDLTGPSLPVDTLCSSSLSAVHEAMQHLRRGECDLAVAGGVNLYLHPSNYTLMSGKRMLSEDGRCRSFGAGGNGFVPGEGVAVVLLKRLSDAERDNDSIRAVLRGSSINHGGRTNGYTVPSPVAQAEVVREALARAGVSAGEVSFMEAHGTGTELGDPIEIDGLTQAFASDQGSGQHCAIGSLKSNIGHLEAAAGIAGLLKVILQMQHGQIAASLHAQESNPNIDFARTPFRLQRETAPWERPAVSGGDGRTTEGDRIAGVSSFGAGGSNAHVVVAEYRRADSPPLPAPEGTPRLVVLSAKDPERLRERARDLLDWLLPQDPATVDLGAVAHTLQLGREAMDHRLALLVASPADLTRKLTGFVAGEQDIDLHLGNVKEHREALAALGDDGDMATTVDVWIEKGKFDRLLGLWVKGLSVNWAKLYGSRRPPVLPLPGYPFARERYWVGDLGAAAGSADSAAGRHHPLIHTNTSTLDAQRFGSYFSGAEFFLTDHVVNGRKVLPAAAHLEMARAALEASLDGPTGRTVLRNVVWAQPLTVAEHPLRVTTTLYAAPAGTVPPPGDSAPAREVAFEISSVPGEDPDTDAVVHSQGTVRALAAATPVAVDVAALREACGAARMDADECYRIYRSLGLDYGPAQRGIASVAIGDGQALGRLRLPSGTPAGTDAYVLHPSLLDAALQCAVGLFGRDGDGADSGPAPLHLPFALDELDVLGPCTAQMWAWVRYSDDDQPGLGIRKLDIDLLDDTGVPCCRLRGFTSRVYTAETTAQRAGGTQPTGAVRLPDATAAQDGGGAPSGDTLEERTCRYLVDFLATELRVPAERIDADDALEHYGIDSILAMNLTNRLERVFGSLSKTLFYEHQSISALSGYFVDAHRPRLVELLPAEAPEPSATPADETTVRGGARPGPARPAVVRRSPREPVRGDTEIAVIGLAGRYPQARNIREFWQNLAEGRDSVTEIPADRWDHGRYFDPDKNAPGRTYTKWGGFLDGVDRFDSLFFNIAPREAAFMDPQERLFLECVHETFEDAGYTREALSRCDDRGLPGNVGVFVGVMYEEYQLYGAQEQARGRNVTLSGSASTIANRVSYVFDLHGPSMAVDTMCSSSLTALHLACQSLRTGGCEVAVAGGVNLSLHPNKFLMLGSGKYASSKGLCESFGQGGDGYVPGEGVGAVLLKPLARAREDGDSIYGVIRATSVNHGGKTNGYSVPNPRAQYNVIGHALREAGVFADAVSYVEAHGTGTSLGDPIEITGLTQAFREHTERTQFCAIGSVKSNIGHAESAAGIAALTKVLLQMKHGRLAPSLHSEVLNPHIDFDSSPFYVARELAPWSRPTGADGTAASRIAGISSFGAGGTNAHVIVEEYLPAPRPADGSPAPGGPAAVVLSARTDDALRAQAEQLLRWTTGEGATAELADIAHTLQTGREAYEERLGLLAATTGELTGKLRAFLAGEPVITGLYRGRVERRQGTLAVFTADAEQTRTLDAALAQRAYGELVRLWTTGLVVDWSTLHSASASAWAPRRISMPTYPFQGERHWLADATAAEPDQAAVPGHLHPLVHVNSSTLHGQRFTSVYTGEEFFLRDHQVRGRPVLSGAACLELARAAVAASVDEPYRVSGIRNVAWTRPVTLHEPGLTVQVRLRPEQDGEVGFTILSPGDPATGTADTVHSEGVVHVTAQPLAADTDVRVDLPRLRETCSTPGPDADALYASAEARGISYGPGHQGVQQLWTGAGQALARIGLPQAVRDTQHAYGLHPSTLDAGLQACAGLLSGAAGEEPQLPFALDEVEILGPCPPEAWAWVRDSAGHEGAGLRRLDIDICDDEGRVRVRLKGVALRAHPVATTARELFAAPHWVTAVPAPATAPAPEGLVLVVELPDVAAALEAQGTVRVVRLSSGAPDVGRRYTDYALQVFDEVKRLLAAPAHHPVRVQLLAPAVDASLWTGLAAVVRSAGLENPRLLGQMVLVDPEDTPERAVSLVTVDRAVLTDVAVRYRGGLREVLRWREEDVHRRSAAAPWKDGGVYLVTGGAGGLGMVFAQDIARRIRGGRIVIAGRSPRDAAKDTLLEQLRRHGAEAVYVQADVAVRDDVVRLVQETRERYGRIDGVLHAAGFTSDAFVIKKDADAFARVLAPKVAGLVHLDEATQDAELDFLITFSSVAGALGNVGQSDYAAANAFMDAFASHRNALVARGERRGRTLSVAWPLWADGGMRVDAPTERALHERFGLVPLPDGDGLRALYLALASPSDQVMVLWGDRRRIAQTLLSGLLVNGPVPRPMPSPDAADSPGTTRRMAAVAQGLDETTTQQAVAYFKRLLSSVIDLPADRIDAEASLEDYGVDSVMTMEMTRALEEVFGSLPKTLFFEHRTISALTRHLLQTHPQQIGELVPAAGGLRQPPAVGPDAPEQPVPGAGRTWPVPSAAPAARPAGPATASPDVAVIGLAGRYPQARDVREFWQNLAAGRDCVTEIPRDRWDHERFFDARKGAPGKSYSKWGGFLDGVYDFDPQFFNISPREAEIMDPQERLFLQCVHETLEDAGYVRDIGKDRTGNRLDGPVGVFVGVMYQEYQLHSARALENGAAPVVPGNSASVANRVSHVFNFRGPSLSVDTMCSSSLTAVHLACRSLEAGECDTAVAGGVNLSLHPNKYVLLSQGRLASSNGRCASFGTGGDGYAPGEGVGAVLLKPLARAVADGDRIYGVIKGTAANHRGRTSGYSVPEPLGQAEVIGEALRRAGVDARDVSYIEANSVGTSLGDPVEIAGLCKAFDTDDRGFCAIGSVKSNIGHAESAAGIAGITKVLLQLEHGALAPSLHASELNPHIDFEQTPFVVQRESAEWPAPVADDGTRGALPRVAGVSAFGAGGSNAHVVIAEYVPDSPLPRSPADTGARAVIPLSARTTEQLRARAEHLVEWLGRPENADLVLTDVAYTLQVGREAREERLGVVAASVPELVARLGRFLADEFAGGDVVRGSVADGAQKLTLFSSDSDLDVMIAAWAEKGKYEKLLELWVSGVPVSWQSLYRTATPRRVALPAYPFAAERYYAFDDLSAAAPPALGGPAPLHPLVQANTSDFSEQRFTSVVTGQERFLGDGAARTVPGVAFLEMAVAACCLSSRASVDPTAPVVLRDISFAQPLAPGDGRRATHVGLRPEDDGDIRFRIRSTPAGGDSDGDAVEHSTGVLYFAEGAAETVLDVPALQRACRGAGLTGEQYHQDHQDDGPAPASTLHVVRHIWTGPGHTLIRLALPDPDRDTEDGLVLHPGLLDAAVQVCSGVRARPAGPDLAEGGSGPATVRAIDEILVLDACTASMWAWVRPAAEPAGPGRAAGFDIDLADDQGRVRIRIGGLSFDPAASDRDHVEPAALGPAAGPRDTTPAEVEAAGGQPLLLRAQWQARPAPTRPPAVDARPTVLLAGVPGLAPLLRSDDADVLVLASEEEVPERRYTAYGQQVLRHLRSLERGAAGPTHVQLVVPGTPEATLLTGLAAVLRTAGLQNPALTGQVVVLDRTDTPERAVLRIRENRDVPEETLVRYVDGRREVLAWAACEDRAAPHPPPWKENGVYLSAGASGALARTVAREIATQTGNATVIIVGPSPLDAETREVLRQPAVGSAVHYEQADISSRSAADALVARLLERHGGIDGVVLSAGATRDELGVLAPEAAGVVNLDAATRSLPLDFFVTVSSPAGAGGGAGQVDGAAAHGFLDAYARHRQDLVAGGERRGHSQSVNWPPEAAGIGEFHRILHSEYSQILVAVPPGGRTLGDASVPTQRKFLTFPTDGTNS
ncbi:SDR family NAD(P)-dependent oxidoreductase [Streptomyces sp. NBC_01166]|uniref:SDR family NAD(P)-dependent oxidoreductase n=1 Tax=Streptomyces sp. NBC_01166 TaxID=2903755 RepID=UPI003865947D|nr:SDR family NAD(P)-dependent oxidoreductase [Streptomyces sp. NBC_01166]